MPDTRRIELLLASDDYSWGAEVFDVPADVELTAVHAWFFEKGPGAGHDYRKVVFVGVLNENPDQG